jgi:VCBS repeat-containing protein
MQRRRSASPRAAIRRLVVEILERRHLLAVTGIDLTELAVNPELFDSSRILVRFKPDAPELAGSAILAGTEFGATIDLVPGLRSVTLSPDVTVETALAAYKTNPYVLYAEPDYHVQLELTPNDTRFPSLWGLNNTGQTGGTIDADIDAVEAWDTTTGGGTTIVAVIDTGVDYTHPDLAANIWNNPGEIPGNSQDDDGNGYVDDVHGYDFVNFDGDPMDDHSHGTHVAGTIGAVGNNGVGVAGVNWNVQIMALKFLDAFGGGFTEDAIQALNYAVAKGAKISNNSWGGGGYSQALFDAIRNAQSAGHIFVAAAGNEGSNNDSLPFFPASYSLDNIISVAATDHNDNLASFSNFGATSVDLGAPGVNILSTTPGNTYDTFSGTSMATPHVVGVVALVRELHPEWTYGQVVNQILSTVDPVAALAGTTASGGRLNAAAAVGAPAPDTRGPRVVTASWYGAASETVDTVRVTWSEPIAAATFAPADISGFSGPGGSIVVSSVTVVNGTNNRQFDIKFPVQTTFGSYTMTIGPNITDLANNPMNQDNDGTNGEPGEDRYTTDFALLDVLVFTSTDVPAPIFDWTYTISYLEITPAIPIADINVEVDLSHTWVGDLEIYLASPAAIFPFGPYVELFLYRGGGGDNLTDTVFDDEATTHISAGTAPFTGSFRPEGTLSDFDGLTTFGVWQLWIGDTQLEDEGMLLGWRMIVTPEGSTPPPPPPPPPENTAPVADNESYTTGEDQALAIAAPGVLDGDTDADGDALTAVLAAGPSHGTLVLNANGSFTYTPAANYSGSDNFTYRASDGTDLSNLATVDITISPVNDPPLAVDDSATGAIDTPLTFDGASGNPPRLEANDTDVEGGPLSIASVQNALHGNAVVNGDGTVTFTPEAGYSGPASFEYTVRDTGGLTDVGLVQIDVIDNSFDYYYFSTATGGTLVGSSGTPLSFADADIVRLAVGSSGAYDFELYFDGSDVGLTTGNEDIDAFDILPNGSIVLSTVGTFSVPGPSGISIGGGGHDLLLFTPTSLGSTTAGVWHTYFDGNDVGLTTNNENVDAVSVLEDGRLLISTSGNVSVSGASGDDKDLLAFTPTLLGDTTAGTWAMYFDGSDVALTSNAEDVDALFVDPAAGAPGLPALFFSTRGNFAVTGVSGTNNDVFQFTPTLLGGTTTGSYAPGLSLDGSQFGLDTFDIDGIQLGLAPELAGTAVGIRATRVSGKTSERIDGSLALLVPDAILAEMQASLQPAAALEPVALAIARAVPRDSLASGGSSAAAIDSRPIARKLDDVFARSADDDWNADRLDDLAEWLTAVRRQKR